jgi:hypothetical protein
MQALMLLSLGMQIMVQFADQLLMLLDFLSDFGVFECVAGAWGWNRLQAAAEAEEEAAAAEEAAAGEVGRCGWNG